MTLLVFDTSSAAITAAVLTADGDLLSEVTERGATAHGELLAPTISQCLHLAGLAPVDLTDIAVGVGPGPFTGLRVGIVTARVMANALNIPVHGVCSLDGIAKQVVGQGLSDVEFAVVTDARRREVYVATYDAGGVRLSGPSVQTAASLDPSIRQGVVCGAGAELYPGEFSDVRPPEFVSAAWLGRVVIDHPERVTGTTPLYLRRPDAVENAGRKRVTPL